MREAINLADIKNELAQFQDLRIKGGAQGDQGEYQGVANESHAQNLENINMKLAEGQKAAKGADLEHNPNGK